MGFFTTPEKFRALRQAEIDLAWQVFRNTLPYKRIFITDELGASNRPYIQINDAEGIGTGDYYYLHMGPIGYADASSTATMEHDDDEVRNTFIHELTHVWQAYQENKSVFFRSIVSQGCAIANGSYDAYSYELGYEWDSYNVEQQARLVEDWYKKDKMATNFTPRYDYICSHIQNR